METDIRVEQCDECGNRISDKKDYRYAAVPTAAVPRRVRRGRNPLFRNSVGRVCSQCAIESRLKDHRPDKGIYGANGRDALAGVRPVGAQ